jgi:multiple sugar transport system permease protein
MTSTSEAVVHQARKDRRKKLVRDVFGRGAAYLALILFAVAMIFPFVYMAAGAVKTPTDTFRYPPKILPRSPATAVVGGEVVELYAVEVPDSGTETLYLAESGIEAGVFASLSDIETTVAWPLELAVETTETVVLDGETYTVYSVMLGGETSDLALIRNTAVGRFASVDDDSVETYAVVRTAEQAEVIEAQWENFQEIIDLRNFDRSLTNTILVTILVVAGTLFTSIMGGYAFSRIRFKGRDALFLVYIGSTMIPFVVIIIPLFRLMVSLGWVDTLGSLVWPFLFNAYGTFLMRQFFVSIPKDLEEAAFIDGAKRWRILWTIFVPLSWPAIATLATFMFLYAWNSFIWPLVSINGANSDDFVLTIALNQLGGQAGEGPNLIFAAIVLSVLIPFAVFIMAQRYFVENVATSGIK